MKFLSSLTPMQRGIGYVVLGVLILFDSIGWLGKGIHLVIFLSALGLIFYGIKLTGLLDTLMAKK